MSIQHLEDDIMIMYENYTDNPGMFYIKLSLRGRCFQINNNLHEWFLDQVPCKPHLYAQILNDLCQNYNSLKEHLNF